MNLLSVATGGLVLVYGIVVLFTRIASPEKHLRLTFLKRKLGSGKGTIIHTIIYIIAPFILAIYLITHGMSGESLRQIFTPPGSG